MRKLLLALIFAASMLHGDELEGLWQGYDGEWGHVSRQLIALAEATPAEMTSMELEKTVTAKADVVDWLKRSLEAVKTAHAGIKPAELTRKVKIEGRDATVDGMYPRIIVHANQHMGQLIAYARMNGIVPPWSKPGTE